MTDDGNRTEKGPAPGPFGIETADTIAPSDSQPSASRSLPAVDQFQRPARERYKIMGEVGRGGLGRILRARDEYLDRPVAVKELLAPDEAAQARFVREALITARLQHPAIVPIYDAGHSEDKGPFYAMKLVAGSSLAEKLAETKTLEERLAFLPSVIAVVDAMAYAHSEHIVHRDLKPHNVLVGNYGETVLIDWGLAKDLTAAEAQRGPYRASSSSSETMDGAVMGTPAFMPPEQAAGEDVDARADVYSLGAMLYFLIAGVAPHGGRNMDDMLLKIVSGDIIPVQEREPRCPADLAAIVAKAMAKSPGDRYPTAGELADDLKKFQTGQLVGAHQYTLGERFRRWLKRHRGVVAVATIALLVLIAYGIWSIQRIREREAEALANAAEATRQRDRVQNQAMLVRARQYAATGHTAEEIAVLRALSRRGDEGYKLAIEDGGLIWKAHQRLAMALGRDAKLTQRSADGRSFTATQPGALVTWDIETGKEMSRMAITGETARFGRVLAISPTAKYAIVRECIAPATTCGVDIILDGNVFVPRPETALQLRDASGKIIARWQRESGPLDRRAIAFAADDSAFVLWRAHIEIYDAAGTKVHEVDPEKCEGPLAIASTKRFAIACKDKVVLHVDDKRSEILKGFAPQRLVFVGADRLLAIGGEHVKLWDLTRSELRGEGTLVLGAQREDEEESDELAWSYFVPNAAKSAGEATVPQIRVGHTTSIVARTSVLSPPPRITTNGVVLSLEGHDWQALVVQDDGVRYALVDQLVPAEPPERCLSRVGGERHATTALDNGERLLIDQQELALGLDAAPPEGYRHTTTAEAPIRQLRPLVAAETGACLAWSTWSMGAHRIDAGVLPPLAGVVGDGAGGLVVVGTRDAFKIDKAGKRTPLEVATSPVIAPSGTHVASVDPATRTVTITSVATGKPVRTWTAPDPAPADPEWIAKDVVFAFGHVVSTDPAIAPRPYTHDLVTDPRSPVGLRVLGADINAAHLVRVADGAELARYPDAIVGRPFPDATNRAIIATGNGTRDVILDGGKRLTLEKVEAEIVSFDVVGDLLIGHQKSRTDAWDLATGKLLAVPANANLVAILGDTLWTIEDKATLVRMKRDGTQRRTVTLSSAGLATFQRIVDEVSISDDRKTLSARYALDEERFAYAVWDVETGALLWIGPPTATLIGDWIVAGGRAFVPDFTVDAVIRDSGARTNLRACESDLRVVPVDPPPSPDSIWAPPAACTAAR